MHAITYDVTQKKKKKVFSFEREKEKSFRFLFFFQEGYFSFTSYFTNTSSLSLSLLLYWCAPLSLSLFTYKVTFWENQLKRRRLSLSLPSVHLSHSLSPLSISHSLSFISLSSFCPSLSHTLSPFCPSLSLSLSVHLPTDRSLWLSLLSPCILFSLSCFPRGKGEVGERREREKTLG